MNIEWIDGFKLCVGCDGHSVTLSANGEGLLSLAKQLVALAGEAPGAHIHYDKYNALEDDSIELIIERID